MYLAESPFHPPTYPPLPPPNPQTSVRTGGRCGSGSIGGGFFVSGGGGGCMGVGLDHDERAGQIVGAAIIRGEGGVRQGRLMKELPIHHNPSTLRTTLPHFTGSREGWMH